VAFDVPDGAYDRFMGRYSAPLSPQLADLAGVRAGQRALDVGCGPGAMTSELVARLGADAVAAADPSASFADAARRRHPGVDVREAPAEALPFADDAFDVVLAQLVVPFMRDRARGLRELRRVARPGGVVAACVWDHAGGRSPLEPFWRAVRALDPGVHDESGQPGAREGELATMLAAARLADVRSSALTVEVGHASFEAWWEPFTLGVGPAGAHVARLGEADRDRLRERCREELGDGPGTLSARAWAARGTA
jgi:SAM-dependent methyltransferase